MAVYLTGCSQAHRAAALWVLTLRAEAALSGSLPTGGIRTTLGGPVQFGDRSNADFSDRLLALGVLRILTRADLTFDLHVRALGERRGVLTEFSPRDAAVPGRVALALAG